MNIKSNIYECVNASGEFANISEFADALNVNPSTVYRWIDGDKLSKCSLGTLCKIAKILNCEISDLFTIENKDWTDESTTQNF